MITIGDFSISESRNYDPPKKILNRALICKTSENKVVQVEALAESFNYETSSWIPVVSREQANYSASLDSV